MKLLFSTAVLLLSFSGFSQEKERDVREHLKLDTSFFSKPTLTPGTRMEATIIPQQKLSQTPAGKEKLFIPVQAFTKDSSRIRILPFDNMPCIVPNTMDIAAMPNVWKEKVAVPFRSRIPNAAQPRIKADINIK